MFSYSFNSCSLCRDNAARSFSFPPNSSFISDSTSKLFIWSTTLLKLLVSPTKISANTSSRLISGNTWLISCIKLGIRVSKSATMLAAYIILSITSGEYTCFFTPVLGSTSTIPPYLRFKELYRLFTSLATCLNFSIRAINACLVSPSCTLPSACNCANPSSVWARFIISFIWSCTIPYLPYFILGVRKLIIYCCSKFL